MHLAYFLSIHIPGSNGDISGSKHIAEEVLIGRRSRLHRLFRELLFLTANGCQPVDVSALTLMRHYAPPILHSSLVLPNALLRPKSSESKQDIYVTDICRNMHR